MSDTTEPSWIREGGTAAVSGHGDTLRIDFVTIERLTSTRIILADGRRFRRAGDYNQVEAGAGNVYRLLDPHSPDVVRRVARDELTAVLSYGADLYTSRVEVPVSRMSTDQIRATIADMIARLQQATASIDQVAAPERDEEEGSA